MSDPVTFLLFHGSVFSVSLAILIYSADLIVNGISEYAKKLGLSDGIVGFVIVAMAASMPEVVASLSGLAQEEPGVLFGTILGTNMVHLGLLMGALALFSRKLKVECEVIQHSKTFVWVILLLPFLLASDGELSRPDGIILVGAFIAYLVKIWHAEEKRSELKKYVQLHTIWRDAVIFIGGLVAMLLAGRYLVFATLALSHFAGIPTYLIALTVIAISSAIPDFLVGLRAIRKGHQSIGVGDIVGSTIMELLLFLGVVAIVHPLSIDLAHTASAGLFLLLGITLMMYFLHKKVITRTQGGMLVGLYVVFLAGEILRASIS